jgi:hypothetical protein
MIVMMMIVHDDVDGYDDHGDGHDGDDDDDADDNDDGVYYVNAIHHRRQWHSSSEKSGLE